MPATSGDVTILPAVAGGSAIMPATSGDVTILPAVAGGSGACPQPLTSAGVGPS
jgi:hypothetical protein